MTPLPNGWRVHQQKPDRDPEQELGRLKRRFGAITRRFDRADAFRYRRKARAAAFTLLLFAVGLGVPFALMKLLSPWPLMTTIRHLGRGTQLRRRPLGRPRSRARGTARLLVTPRCGFRWRGV